MKQILPPVFSLFALLTQPAFSQAKSVNLDVPYVPTPQTTVDAMLDMVDLKDGDVVWDLGCGDGRMVITAAKRKDIRGMGVDIDPKRIEESKENAKEAGVSDKVNFQVADLFETDFSDATVLTMYLLESVNLRLRPVILRDLQPGARIVSNTFTMGDWKPDNTDTSDEEAFRRTAYFWVVPANLTGEWTWTMDGDEGTLKIDQQFQNFTGTYTHDGKSNSFDGGTVKGKEVTFSIEVPDREKSTYTAVAEGDTMSGKIEGKEWKAVRTAGTRVPLDPTDKVGE
jgi:SAM-dependent methyltransferase